MSTLLENFISRLSVFENKYDPKLGSTWDRPSLEVLLAATVMTVVSTTRDNRYRRRMNQPSVGRIDCAFDFDVSIIGERARNHDTLVIDCRTVELEGHCGRVQSVNLVL